MKPLQEKMMSGTGTGTGTEVPSNFSKEPDIADID